MAALKVLTSWSFSRFADYEQCPLKAKLKHIDKIKEPPNDAMARGSAIGQQAEYFIKGAGKFTAKRVAVPQELKAFAAEFKAMRKRWLDERATIVVEETWAFKKDWTPTTWNDWAGCWVRIKLDAAHLPDSETVVVTDWKTGRYRPDNVDSYLMQLELYALGALLTFPQAKRVIPRLGYLDAAVWHPKPGEEKVYTRADLPALKKTWEKRVKAMLTDRRFAPKPNAFCGWCHFRADNRANGGGQCQF